MSGGGGHAGNGGTSGTGGASGGHDAGVDVAPCVPNCAGKTCGGDGCGGICAQCPSGKRCNAAFQCVAETPNGCPPGTGLDPQAPWPTAGRCYARQGAVSVASVGKPSITWSYAGALQGDPVIGRGGTLYFSTYAYPAGYTFQAVTSSGTLSWSLSNTLPATTPTIGPDGTLYFVMNTNSAGSSMIAMGSNGTIRWKTPVGSGSSGVVLGADGAVYTGSDDGTLYAFNSDGSPRFTKAALAGSYSFPAVGSDGTLYFTYGGVNAVKPDGTVLWQTPISASDGLYVGVNIGPDGTLYTSYAGASGYHSGGLTALDPATGAVRWTVAFDDPVYKLPAIAGDGTIYVPLEVAVVAVAPNGTVLWKVPSGNVLGGVSVGGDGTIYVTSQDENLYALNANGSIRWTMPFGQAWGTPTIGADGTIYVRGANALAALGCAGGACNACVPDCTGKRCGPDNCGGSCGACGAGDRCELLSRTCQPIAPPAGLDTCGDTRGLQAGSPWPMLGRCPTHTAQSQLVGPHTQPAVKWSYAGTGFSTEPLLGADGTIYLAGGKLYAISPTGAALWSVAAPAGTNAGFGGTPALGADGTIYAASGTSSEGRLSAIRPDGSKRWTLRFSCSSPSNATVGPDGTLYAEMCAQFVHSSRLVAVDPLSGTLRWATYAGTVLEDAPSLAPDGTSYVTSASVYAFDPLGAILWSTPFVGNDFPQAAPVLDQAGNVYAFTGALIASYDRSGTTRWSVNVGSPTGVSGSLAMGTDGSILVPPTGEFNTTALEALDPATGVPRWTTTIGGNVIGSPLVDASGWIYYVAPSAFGASGDIYSLFALDGAGKLQWSLVLPAAIAQSPVLGPGQIIYLAAKNGSLYAVGP